MTADVVTKLIYLLSAVLFILGLRNLSSPRTAVLGNNLAAIGMLIAVVATLLVQEVVGALREKEVVGNLGNLLGNEHPRAERQRLDAEVVRKHQ